ncbi:MAG: Hsp70 family protein, partial [Clostridia bacterium]
MSKKVYGIDLGTTNSAIAVYENDETRILKNLDGYEITPSVIFFTGTDENGNDEILVGEQAKNSAATSPENVVQFVKRLIGHKGSAYNHLAPSGKEYTPEELSALILRKICQDAAQFVGENEVKDVVITVPAYFDDARRVATRQAGKIAGLNVLRVINEPTAAAIAFGVDTEQSSTVLVYDLGGGTFDVTIMNIRNGNFEVVSTSGDPELGGVNFDQKIIALIVNQLSEQGYEVDDEDDALLAEIREKAEKTKVQLSAVGTSRPAFTIDGKTYRIDISREDFENEARPLMERTQIILEEVMTAAGVSWNEIDHLLMVGGSTRMPMVKKMLEEISGKTIVYKVDPDTAVARGAAVFASTLGDSPLKDINENNAEPKPGKIGVQDVTSQSMGIISLDSETQKDINSIIIPHNTKIPTKQSEIFYTVADDQTEVRVRVTEGDDRDPEFVHIIGESYITMEPHPKESPLRVEFAYDMDQTVYIEVIDELNGESL